MWKRLMKMSVALLAAIIWVWVLASSAMTVSEAAAPAASATGSGLPFSEELAELGDQIFDDKNLSIGRNQGCNACHSEAWGFTGPDPGINALGAVYEGSIAGRFGHRKPPSSAYSTLSPVFGFTRKAGGQFEGGNFWDGRATGEKLGNPAADQAQGPFLNHVEQGLHDSACVVHRVSTASYADLSSSSGAPASRPSSSRPTSTPFAASRAHRSSSMLLNRAMIKEEFDNIAISLAVYEESHNLFSSKFDATRKGLYQFTPQERLGFTLFQGQGQCARCHPSEGQRPSFTDHTYDNLGVPPNPDNPIYLTHPGFVDLGLGGFLATRPEWASLPPARRAK